MDDVGTEYNCNYYNLYVCIVMIITLVCVCVCGYSSQYIIIKIIMFPYNCTIMILLDCVGRPAGRVWAIM